MKNQNLNQQPVESQPQQQVPIQPKQPVMTSQQPQTRWLLLLIILGVALISYAGIAYWQNMWPFKGAIVGESPTPTPGIGTTVTPTPEKNVFINPNGKYSFEYPSAWEVAINQYINNNSLFGPNANSSSGLGGLEIFANQTPIDAFIERVDWQITNKNNVTIDGVSGVRISYTSLIGNGIAVVLLKDDKIYNIFVNNVKDDDIKFFDQILSTFKFTMSNETIDWKTYRKEELGFEFRYPNSWLLNEDKQNDRVTIASMKTIQNEEERIRMCYDDDPTTKCISEGAGFDIVFKLRSSDVSVNYGAVSFGDNLFTKYEAMGLLGEEHYKIEHNSKIYDFGVITTGASNIGQILSTFKFIN